MNDVHRQVGDITKFTPGNDTARAQLDAEIARLRECRKTEWTKYRDRQPRLEDGPIMVCEPGWDEAWFLAPSEVVGCWMHNCEVTFDWSDAQDWLWAPCPKPPPASG